MVELPRKAGKVGGEGDKEGVRRDVQSSSQYFGNASLGPHSGSNACENDAISKITHAVGSFLKTINSLQKFGQVYISAAQNFVADVRRIIGKASRLIVGAMKMILNTMRDKIFKFLGKRFRDFIGLIVPEPQKSPIAMASQENHGYSLLYFRETRSKYIWLYHWILKGVS